MEPEIEIADPSVSCALVTRRKGAYGLHIETSEDVCFLTREELENALETIEELEG